MVLRLEIIELTGFWSRFAARWAGASFLQCSDASSLLLARIRSTDPCSMHFSNRAKEIETSLMIKLIRSSVRIKSRSIHGIIIALSHSLPCGTGDEARISRRAKNGTRPFEPIPTTALMVSTQGTPFC